MMMMMMNTLLFLLMRIELYIISSNNNIIWIVFLLLLLLHPPFQQFTNSFPSPHPVGGGVHHVHSAVQRRIHHDVILYCDCNRRGSSTSFIFWNNRLQKQQLGLYQYECQYHHRFVLQSSISNTHQKGEEETEEDTTSIRSRSRSSSRCKEQIHVHIPLNKVTQKLHDIINKKKLISQNKDQEEEQQQQQQEVIICTEGYITHRRIFGSSLGFIDLVASDYNSNSISDDNNDNSGKGEQDKEQVHEDHSQHCQLLPILQALLKRQEYQPNQSTYSSSTSYSSSFKSILKSLHPGTKISIKGKASTTQNPGEVVLLVTNVKFIGFSHNPEHLKGMLQRIRFLDNSNSSSSSSSSGGDDFVVEEDVNDNNNNHNYEVDGLILDDVIDAFHGIVDIHSLKEALNGNVDAINDLIVDPSTSISTSSLMMSTSTKVRTNNDNNNDDENVKQWNSKRIAYAKIARLIVNSLPDDPNYPSAILEMKGSSRNSRKSNTSRKKNEKKKGGDDDNDDGSSAWQYPTLPLAQEDIRTVPSIVQSLVGASDDDDESDSILFENSNISSLLKGGNEDDNGKYDINNNNDPATNQITTISSFTISGWVQNRRRFQGDNSAITVLELVEDDSIDNNNNNDDDDDSNNTTVVVTTTTSPSMTRLKCVLHASCMTPSGSTTGSNNELSTEDTKQSRLPSDIYGHLMAKGTQVQLKGFFYQSSLPAANVASLLDNTDSPRPIFWVNEASILRLSWRPNIVRYFLDCLVQYDDHHHNDENTSENMHMKTQLFDLNEITNALVLPNHDDALKLIHQCKNESTTERQWRAAELSRKLQNENSRMGKVSEEMKLVLKKYSWLREKYTLEHIDVNEEMNDASTSSEDSILSGNQDLMNIRSARPKQKKGNQDKFLRMSLEGSRWQRAKRPQLQWMTNQIRKVVQSHPDLGIRPLAILDIGGGRGHLANYLAAKLGQNQINVHVIDIDSRTIRNGMMEAKEKTLNVQYKVGDASRLFIENNWKENNSKGGESEHKTFDVVVALHACGVLSDVALAHAVINNAAMVVTPCCFRSNPHLQVAMPEVGDDLHLTQNMVQSSEWLGIDKDELDTIKLAAELQGDLNTSGCAIHTLCALRAQAISKHLDTIKTVKSNQKDLKIQLSTFPISFSTRNYCIIGTFS